MKEFRYLEVLFMSEGTMEWEMGCRIGAWVMTDRMRSRIKAGITLRDKVRISVIWEGLGVEPLLLYIERSHLRW